MKVVYTEEDEKSIVNNVYAEVVDLQGKTLMPGFIDSHSHLIRFSQALTTVDLTGSTNLLEIAQRITNYIEINKLAPDAWVVGFGYDNNLLPDNKNPNRDDLDKISTTHPIFITHASGHVGAMNSKALEEFGVDENTPDIEGGVIERYPDSRKPTGYMEETAFLGYAARVPAAETDTAALFRKAQQLYLSQGITTVQDSLLKEKEYTLLAEAADKGVLTVDVVGYVDLKNAPDLAQAHPERLGQYRNRFKIDGYKIFLDGSPQGRTAWLSEPYLPVPGAVSGSEADPDYCGYPIDSDETVTAFARTAALQGLPLQAHCNGDAAADQLIRAYRNLKAEGIGEFHRPVMIHSQIVRPEQFAELAELGITASLFPAHIFYWGDVHLKNLGKERGARISAAATALKAGVTVTVHQDSPVIRPNMLESLGCLVMRQTSSGVVLAPEERISPAEALKAMTLSAAVQIGEEASKGSVEPGKRADFAVLDADPLTVAPEEIGRIRVLRTVKDGRTVYIAE